MQKKRIVLIVGSILVTLCILTAGFFAKKYFQTSEPKLTLASTPDGIKYGIFGAVDKPHAPVAFTLGFNINDAFVTYMKLNKLGLWLHEKGFLMVALDVPDHEDTWVNERPMGLAGWARRVDQGENFGFKFAQRCSSVLSHLIAEGKADAERVMSVGISRTGFLAMYFAAQDSRVKAAIGISPVTNLLRLYEFSEIQNRNLANLYSLTADHAARLANRPVFLFIGASDSTVGTDDTIAFSRQIAKAADELDELPQVELHVTSVMGHSAPIEIFRELEKWIPQFIKLDEKESRL